MTSLHSAIFMTLVPTVLLVILAALVPVKTAPSRGDRLVCRDQAARRRRPARPHPRHRFARGADDAALGGADRGPEGGAGRSPHPRHWRQDGADPGAAG